MPCGSKTSTDFTHEHSKVRFLSWLPRALVWLAVLFDKPRRRRILLELEKARQRGILKDIDERMLKDIGLTRQQALREARKPFWSGVLNKLDGKPFDPKDRDRGRFWFRWRKP